MAPMTRSTRVRSWLTAVIVVAVWVHSCPRSADEGDDARAVVAGGRHIPRPALRESSPVEAPAPHEPPPVEDRVGDDLVRVSGTVTDRLTHEPVPGVEVVFATDDCEASTLADNAGFYAFALPAGRYRPFARGAGVISTAPSTRERQCARPHPEEIAAPRLDLLPVLELSHPTDGVDLQVDRSGKVRGRVVGRDGEPVVGALVRAFAAGETSVTLVLGTDVVETNSAGEFELEVAATSYRLDAFHPDFGGVSEETFVTVNASEISEAEITMRANCVISGRVVRADGRPAGRGVLERGVVDAGVRYSVDGAIDDDGSFVWSTSETGTLSLRARPWASPASTPLSFTCEEGARYADVIFVLPNTSATVSGRAVTAEGRPLPFAIVDIRGESDGDTRLQERTDEAGNWAVYSLPAGEYRVAIANELGAVVARVTAPVNGIELRTSGLGDLVGEVRGLRDGTLTLTASFCKIGEVIQALELRRVVSVVRGRYKLVGVPACTLDIQIESRDGTVSREAAIISGGVTTLDLDFRPI
jgi:Carboxypeptidase regulatory-like domain